jgi:hypothetical protein
MINTAEKIEDNRTIPRIGNLRHIHRIHSGQVPGRGGRIMRSRALRAPRMARLFGAIKDRYVTTATTSAR